MEKPKVHILYVEDDVNLRFVTSDNLEMHGYQITTFSDGASVMEALDNPGGLPSFDLCILDVMLPKVDGFTIARFIRERNPHVPILFLSARAMKEDRITGLKTGADDYIIKPFSMEELILRIELFLKRKQVSAQSEEEHYRLGGYPFHFRNLQLICPQETISLTFKEAQLLQYFCQYTNQLLKREDTLNRLWGDDDYFMGRSLDVFVSRLRKYLRHDERIRLENVHGVGFVMRVKAQSKEKQRQASPTCGAESISLGRMKG
jgi:DNA-binding response OmpR family regulator